MSYFHDLLDTSRDIPQKYFFFGQRYRVGSFISDENFGFDDMCNMGLYEIRDYFAMLL